MRLGPFRMCEDYPLLWKGGIPSHNLFGLLWLHDPKITAPIHFDFRDKPSKEWNTWGFLGRALQAPDSVVGIRCSSLQMSLRVVILSLGAIPSRNTFLI
jgi:hypothetical protein